MNDSQYRISLDVHSADSQVQLTARRGETGRLIRANLTERGTPYFIASGCIAEFVAKLPDGSVLKNACGITDNAITYKLTSRTTALSGVLECELRLLDYSNELLVSPRFTIAVYDTVYNQGDAVIQEGPSASTVKSSEPGYSQVFMWSDGNPYQENRLGYFVTGDRDKNAAMITRADSRSPVIGVAVAIPGFAAGAGQDKYDGSGTLTSAYSYVTMLGFAPVRDLGRCRVNGQCRSDDEGMAVPCSDGGFYVVERIDSNHVTVLVTASGDIQARLGGQLEKKQNKLGWVSREDIDAMLLGAYEGFEEEGPEGVDAILFAVKEGQP